MKKILYIVVSAFVMHTVHGQEIRPSAQPLPEKNYLSYEELIKASANQEDYLWANEAFSHEDRTKEVVGKRSFGSKTFSTDNPRQFVLHAASGEIHYEDNGEWKTIYHSFLPKDDQFVNENNRFKSYYSRNLSAGGYTILPDGKKMEELLDLEMIFLDENGNELQRVVNSEVSGKVFRNELVYSNAFGDFVDVHIQQLSHKKKLDYVLREGFANELPQGTKYVAFREVVLLPTDYQVTLEQQNRASLEELNEGISRCERKLNALAEKGAEVNEKGEDIAKERIKIEQKLSELIQLREIALNDAKSGAVRNVESLTVLDGNGKFAFNIPFPTLSDQSEEQEVSSALATSKKGIASLNNENSFYNVTRNGNELTIDVMVDANWLTAEERVYPVFVDPTTTYEPPYSSYWTGRSTPASKYNDNIYVGTLNPVSSVYAGYEKNDISAFPAGSQVSQILYTFLPYDEYSDFNATQINITEADLDPQTVANNDLRNDLFTENDAYLTGIDASYWGFASSWANAEYYILTTGDLGASAHTKFESQAASTTWFALGMRHTTSPPSTNDQLRIVGYSSAYYPYITVTYVQLPTVTTSVASYTSGTSATGAGNVTSDGGCTVTDRGVCWSSTNATPTIADSYASDATLATGTGAFSNVPMTVGYSSVVYYRAYATCASGTVYGNVLSFITETPAGAPLPTGFYISGTVTNNGTIISTNDQNWMRMTGTSKQVTGSGTFTDTRIFADGSTQFNPTSSLSFTQTYVNASKTLEVLTGKTMNNGSMTNNGTLTLSGTGAINNSDYWTNSGTVTAASTSLVTFSGSSDQNVTSGGSAFGKVTLNNSSGGTYEGIVLQDAMTVNGALTFTDGNIQLGAHNLTIGASGTVVTPSATSHVITASSGVVTKNTLGATEFTFPVGTSKLSYTPIKLANSGTADNFSVYVTDNVLDGGTTGSTYNIGRVSKTWHVSETTNGGSSVTMTPYWTFADEDAQFDRTVALVSHWDGSAWDMPIEAPAQTSSSLYYVSRSGLSSFSPFMVQRSSFTPLPITLSYFGGTCNPEGNEVKWVTSSEQNSSHFDLKRSYDGINWDHVGQKQAAGNSATDIEYVIWDVEGSRHEVTYYELRQFDYNNDSAVFGPIAVRCENIDSDITGKLSPNPTVEASYLAIENCPLGEATITLMSSTGQIVYTDRIMVTKENDVYFIDSLDLTRGSYVIRFQAPNGQIVAMKLVKN